MSEGKFWIGEATLKALSWGSQETIKEAAFESLAFASSAFESLAFESLAYESSAYDESLVF